MSDGPHESLPMSKAWKSVAECCDSEVSESDRIAATLVQALERDLREKVGQDYLRELCQTVNRPPSLFGNAVEAELESLETRAPSPLARAVVGQAICLAIQGELTVAKIVDALDAALIDRTARAERQIEEHYLRKVKLPRAQRLRARIEEGIASARPHIRSLAAAALENGAIPRSQLLKRHGLDDGVRF